MISHECGEPAAKVTLKTRRRVAFKTEIGKMTMGEPSVIQMMIDSQKRIESKLDFVMQNGCSKLQVHQDIYQNQGEIFKRLKQIENDRAEDRGKIAVVLMIAGAIIGGAITMAFRWIGNRFLNV